MTNEGTTTPPHEALMLEQRRALATAGRILEQLRAAKIHGGGPTGATMVVAPRPATG